MPTQNATQVPPHFIPALALPFEPDPPPKASAKPVRPARPATRRVDRAHRTAEPESNGPVRYPN
jgi:hypothetical protein